MAWDDGGDAWEGGAPGNEFNQPAADGFAYDDAQEAGNDTGAGYGGGGGGDFACFNCGEQGHSKADCTAPAKPRPCFNCGEEGHAKAECTNPAVAREFTGTCRLCEETGHRAADCPTAPPKLCVNCQQEGHSALECKNARTGLFEGVDVIPAEQAWDEMKAASDERDLDDFRDAVAKYLKAVPETTYPQLESAFRTQGFNVYLIAMQKEDMSANFTNMDIQGNLGKTFTISYRLSDKHQRPKEKEAWPATPAENLERLEDAGVSVNRGVDKCSNCDELGHTKRSCPEEKVETDRAMVKCFNCEGLGHRVRDCPIERPDKFACRNCKQSGHSSKECPEPRSAEGVECKKCNETGHFAKDCPTGGGGSSGCRNCGGEGHFAKDCTEERKLICRNCDEEGHIGKECPKPRDYSRVKCSNCQQMGHTKVRCKEPIVDEDAGNGYGGGADAYAGGDNAGFGDNDAAAGGFGGDDAGGNDFSAPAAITAGGGGGWEGGPSANSGW